MEVGVRLRTRFRGLCVGLRRKITLILVGLTTTVVVALGLVTYGTIQRILGNFQRSFDLEIPVTRFLMVLKEEAIIRRDYLETFLLSRDVEDLGPVVEKYDELSRRIGRSLLNPIAILRPDSNGGRLSDRPLLRYLEKLPALGDGRTGQDLGIQDILTRAERLNAEFDRVARQLMTNHLIIINLEKNARRVQNDIRQFFNVELREMGHLHRDPDQVLPRVATLRRLEMAGDWPEPSSEKEIAENIRSALAAVRSSRLMPHVTRRLVEYLPRYGEALVFLAHVSRAVVERRALHDQLFRRASGTAGEILGLLNRAEETATAYVLSSLEDNAAVRDRSLGLILITWAVSLSVSVAISVWLIRRITQPLVHLAQMARNLADGVFEGAPQVEGRDEIAVLVDTFNQMGRQIKVQIEELKQAHAQLVAQERLAAIGKIAAGIAHEIRNPLSAIKMNVRILARKQLHAASAEREYWEILDKEVGRLDRIVNDTLTYTQPPLLARTWCDLHGILAECKAIIRQTEPDAVFLEEYDRNLPRLYLDEGRIQQVVLNLLVNACQSMAATKRIGLGTGQVTCDGRAYARLVVADAGTGIPPENLERVYEPFFSTKTRGMGLGLSICRRLVEEHGGRIEVVSREAELGAGPLGGGWTTQFTIFLPMAETG